MDKHDSSKKKSNKLMRKLFKWKSTKRKSEEPGGSRPRGKHGRNDSDEDTCERIKKMEQTRQISAMKNHIEKLQLKLDSMEGRSNNAGSSRDASPAVTRRIGNKDRIKGSNSRKSQSRKNNSKRAMVQSDHPTETCRAPEDDSPDSGEEIRVYVEEDETNPTQGCISDFKSPYKVQDASVDREEANQSGASPLEPCKEASGVHQINSSTIVSAQVSHCGSEGDPYTCPPVDAVTLGSQEIKRHPGDDQKTANVAWEETALFPLQSNTLKESNEIVDLVDSKESLDFHCGGSEWKSDNTQGLTDLESSDENVSHGGASLTSTKQNMQDGETEHHGTKANEFAADPKFDPLEVNVELKERVAELEEQVWLAAEDKRNMQAMLELQKEKALKNLAFKFEDINKKTLREFKGIFEYRLQELNEEKLKLEEKLESRNCKLGRDGGECHTCAVLQDEFKESEVKCAKLMQENVILRRRCRKLSGDLGKVKKAIGALTAAEENSVVEIATQTEPEFIGKRDIGTQCKGSLEKSLNDLHGDVKVIAATVSSLSNHIFTENNQWSDNTERYLVENDALQSLSVNNEDSGNESFRFSPTKSRSEQGDSEIDDEANTSYSQTSDTNEKLKDNSRSGGSTDPVKFGDDVDSGIFGIDISEYEIEKHLDKIHKKYLKISEELDDYENSKLKGKLEDNNKVSFVPLNMLELDPEIVRIIEKVNREYDEYFNNKIVF